jgi:hypothetical protein
LRPRGENFRPQFCQNQLQQRLVLLISIAAQAEEMIELGRCHAEKVMQAYA